MADSSTTKDIMQLFKVDVPGEYGVHVVVKTEDDEQKEKWVA